jgi:segregation and condensation protein B
VLYKTTDGFLRTFGISSLDELPELPDLTEDEDGQLKIQSAIEALQTEAKAVQNSDAPEDKVPSEPDLNEAAEKEVAEE